jgi:two-component system, chemotaxis family, chemotaxis protein CheY
MAHTILVVDDSAVMRASVTYALKSAGYEVAEAHDGKDGLDVLKRLSDENRRPSLILADVNMPVMDGITFIKQAKQSDSKFIPILVLTTESEEKKKLAGKEAGAAGWLVKPFKEEQLIAVVRKFAR